MGGVLLGRRWNGSLQAGAFRGHTFCWSSKPQEGLLDRLSLYLRARIPAVREIHRVHRDGVDIY